MSRSLLCRVAGALVAACMLVSNGAADTSEPAEVARTLYAAFAAGDAAKIDSLLADDVEWTFQGSSARIPYAGAYRGPVGVREFFRLVSETVRVTRFVPVDYRSEGDTVYVTGQEAGTSLATGGRYQVAWVHVIRTRFGRITRFEEYSDTAAIADALEPADPLRGEAYFSGCAGCHAPSAAGNRYMNAPNLTGISADVLTRQLRQFRTGDRGGPADFYGWMMNGRARALPGDRAVRDVVAYIGSLPVHRPAVTLRGDVRRGRTLYAACVGCHGAQGEGSSVAGGPALRGLDDWYLVRQLQSFRSGLRGATAGDEPGRQMRAAVATLTDEAALSDVVAYIHSID